MLKKNLPEDVIIEILSRLPSGSLVRFKSVHKSWYVLIESPQFIAMQLNNNSSIHFLVNNRILTDTSEMERISWSLLTFDDRMQATFNREDVSFAVERLDLQFSSHNRLDSLSNLCDGIICFYGTYDTDGTIIMANPGTREFMALPESCIPDFARSEFCILITKVLGVGFDRKTNDFKVIRILEIESIYGSPSIPLVEVYTLSSNCWREIEYKDDWIHEYYGLSTYWNGAYYWPAYTTDSRGIYSFDFSDEVIQYRTLPDFISNPNYNLIEFNETVALISYPHQEMEKSFDIWVLLDENGASGVWTKLLTIESLLGVDRAFGFWKSNELLVLLSNKVIASYNIVTNQIKALLPFDFDNMAVYKGSLVSINKGINHGR